jgi:osmoprotectant transport system permease protein
MIFLAPVADSGGPVIPDFGKTSQCVLDNRLFCWNWFSDRWGGTIVPLLIQHIELTAMAVGFGFVISFALAVLAHRHGWLTNPVTLLSSLLYTIPSLALFEVLVGYIGPNWYMVEIALTSYTLLLLFTNILAGLSGVSPEILDAANGMGLTRSQVLLKIELPLAVPAIIAGLRIAVVTVISLATIAAYATPTGLGKLIFDALSNGGFNTAFLAGGILCVLLAIVADGLFVLLQRGLTPWATARRGA